MIKTMRLGVHPTNPQQRLINQAAIALEGGGIGICPTDCTYVLVAKPENKEGLERIRKLRSLSSDHRFTLLCRDLSQISSFARLSNSDYRLLKAYTPGPFTFILQASREVPKRLLTKKRNSIGLRISDHPASILLLDAISGPLLISTLILPSNELPLFDPDRIEEEMGGRVEFFIDSGPGGMEVSSVIDLLGDQPSVIRQGKGNFTQGQVL